MLIKWLKNRAKKEEAFCEREDEKDAIRKCWVYYIPCDRIRPNALRSRSDFNEDKLVSLAYSIKKYGIIEPLCVRRTMDGDSYDYELIAGERRLRAARLSGISAVPCVIIDVDEQFLAEMSLVENLFRADLDCFEIAFALKRITELSEDSFNSVACRLNMPEEDILKKLYLLELSFDEREALTEHGISEDIAAEIGKISDVEHRSEIIRLITEKDASESVIRSYLDTSPRGNARELPRDVSSFIKGLRRKVEQFDRRKRFIDMNVSNDTASVVINIRIRK